MMLVSRQTMHSIVLVQWQARDIDTYEAIRQLYNLGFRGRDLVLKVR